LGKLDVRLATVFGFASEARRTSISALQLPYLMRTVLLPTYECLSTVMGDLGSVTTDHEFVNGSCASVKLG